MRGRFVLALILIASLFSSINAYAHGTVGDYTFLEPIVADDANPKNELDLLRPQWTRMAGCRVFSLGFSLEKVIAASTPELTSNGVANDGLVSLTLGDDWIYQSPRRGKSASGFNELELLPKWAFLTMPEHEFRLSLGMRIIIPAGSPSVEAQHHTQLGPEFLWVKGMGELGNDGLIKYLRPFAVQGDFGYVPALGGRTWHEMFADNVIEYSMPYLNNNVKDLGLGWPLRNLYPYIEFNYDQLVSGPPGQTFPQIAATPGIAFMNYYVELSIATQFALNHASVAGNHATVIGLLDLFIDDIFPPTNWTPL